MNRTRWFMVIIAAVITVFDVWTLSTQGYETTISWQTLVISKQWPVVPFLLGFLAGHLVFPNRAGGASPSAAVPTPAKPLVRA